MVDMSGKGQASSERKITGPNSKIRERGRLKKKGMVPFIKT